MAFGRFLYELVALQRDEKGQTWTLTESAKRLGVDTKTLTAWFNGGDIRTENLLHLSEVLGITFGELAAPLGETELSDNSRRRLVNYYEGQLGLRPTRNELQADDMPRTGHARETGSGTDG